LQVTSGLSVEECIHRFRELEIDFNDPDMILPKDQTPKVDKYDPMVPENLLRSAFLHNQMDVAGAVRILKEIGLS
ncbi:MAG: hypothetical protein PUD50_06805, partial [Eubacteriales bacterium]|nr:hypothetical protein [Eubacteriales bacterium]